MSELKDINMVKNVTGAMRCNPASKLIPSSTTSRTLIRAIIRGRSPTY